MLIQLSGKKIILFGAGIIGKKALLFFGQRNVYAFADNDPGKTFFWGKPVLSFEQLVDIYPNCEIIITVSRKNNPAVEEQLQRAGITNYHFWGAIVSQEDFDPNPRIAAFHNRHQGKRAFIIGNGPSLRFEDLNLLHTRGEITFASNQVFKAFDQTDWRPTYYAAVDDRVLVHNIEAILTLDLDAIFISPVDCIPDFPEKYNRSNIYYINSIVGPYSWNHPTQFSTNPAQGVFAGGSITYTLMQLAIYMGLREIYLLGIDHTLSCGNFNANHFLPSYTEENETPNEPTPHHIMSTEASYKVAHDYAVQHGYAIQNATRGGALEVFPRVDFDSLFKFRCGPPC